MAQLPQPHTLCEGERYGLLMHSAPHLHTAVVHIWKCEVWLQLGWERKGYRLGMESWEQCPAPGSPHCEVHVGGRTGAGCQLALPRSPLCEVHKGRGLRSAGLSCQVHTKRAPVRPPAGKGHLPCTQPQGSRSCLGGGRSTLPWPAPPSSDPLCRRPPCCLPNRATRTAPHFVARRQDGRRWDNLGCTGLTGRC